MPVILIIAIASLLASCASYQGSEMWRRGVCEEIVDTDEKARCKEEASRPENEYKQDKNNATGS